MALPWMPTPQRLTRAQSATLPDYYVYIVYRHTGVSCYVGKGKGTRANRDFTRGGSDNTYLANIVKKDQDNGTPVKVVIAAKNLTEKKAFELEMRLIAEFGRTKNAGPLVNMTDGGPGTDGIAAAKMERTIARLRAFAESDNPIYLAQREQIMASSSRRSRTARGAPSSLRIFGVSLAP